MAILMSFVYFVIFTVVLSIILLPVVVIFRAKLGRWADNEPSPSERAVPRDQRVPNDAAMTMKALSGKGGFAGSDLTIREDQTG